MRIDKIRSRALNVGTGEKNLRQSTNTTMDDDHDPIEDDPKYKAVIEAVMDEVVAELAVHPGKNQLGFCHVIWGTKKRILKEKHGIDWRSPREMNPMNFYD